MANDELNSSDEVCKDIISVHTETRKALKNEYTQELSELSNHTIHCVGIYQSKRALAVAIIIYALSKILEKESIKQQHKDELKDFLEGMASNVDAAVKFLKASDFEKFDNATKNMIKEISDFDNSFSQYIQQVVEFSKIQKGAKMYEHGLSLSSVAELLDVSKWDLMRKVAETKVHEEKPGKAPETKERLKKARNLLGSKKGAQLS